jgi:hypothetical protein
LAFAGVGLVRVGRRGVFFVVEVGEVLYGVGGLEEAIAGGAGLVLLGVLLVWKWKME